MYVYIYIYIYTHTYILVYDIHVISCHIHGPLRVASPGRTPSVSETGRWHSAILSFKGFTKNDKDFLSGDGTLQFCITPVREARFRDACPTACCLDQRLSWS